MKNSNAFAFVVAIAGAASGAALAHPVVELGQIIRVDLEGDGIMEIVIENGYYGGQGVGVFTIEGGEPELILQGAAAPDRLSIKPLKSPSLFGQCPVAP